MKLVLVGLAIFLIASCKKEVLNNNATISTLEVKDILTSTAKCGGIINSDGKLTVLSRGACWSEKQFPTLDNFYTSYTSDSIGFGTFISILSNLNAGKTYYIRAYFTNDNDTIYGNQIEFSTPDYIQFNNDLEYGTVTDIDGNLYKTIQIGDLVWMAENIRTTHFQNGDPIAHVTDIAKWDVGVLEMKTAAYTYYNNDENNKFVHGAQYNWFAASDSRNIAPTGWHVATAEDWQKLMRFVDSWTNGYETKDNSTLVLRETKTAHWYGDGFGGYVSTNSTGFTSIASGRNQFGFTNLGYDVTYWTSTDSPAPLYVYLLDNHISLSCAQYLCIGGSIRCVKD